MDLTVAICTYQRHEPLRITLDSLRGCEPVDIAWELLVVDNGSDAQVKALAESFAGPLPIRYIPEPALGTSYARNRAVREAKAPIVLFTDDDVTFDSGWLKRMVAAIRDEPDCAFWGGRVKATWPASLTPPPAWFDQKQCPMLGDTIVQYDRGDEARVWNPQRDMPFYTANLALRVDAVIEAGYFDTSVGHRGGVRMGMEDSLMVRAISDAGGRGWYVADAIVHHPVPPERVNRSYARRFAWRQGWLSVDMLRRREGRVPWWLLRRAGGSVCGGLGRWLSGLVRGDAGRAFAGQFQALFNLSKIWHTLRR